MAPSSLAGAYFFARAIKNEYPVGTRETQSLMTLKSFNGSREVKSVFCKLRQNRNFGIRNKVFADIRGRFRFLPASNATRLFAIVYGFANLQKCEDSFLPFIGYYSAEAYELVAGGIATTVVT